MRTRASMSGATAAAAAAGRVYTVVMAAMESRASSAPAGIGYGDELWPSDSGSGGGRCWRTATTSMGPRVDTALEAAASRCDQRDALRRAERVERRGPGGRMVAPGWAALVLRQQLEWWRRRRRRLCPRTSIGRVWLRVHRSFRRRKPDGHSGASAVISSKNRYGSSGGGGGGGRIAVLALATASSTFTSELTLREAALVEVAAQFLRRRARLGRCTPPWRASGRWCSTTARLRGRASLARCDTLVASLPPRRQRRCDSTCCAS